jgi:hypothetical protein
MFGHIPLARWPSLQAGTHSWFDTVYFRLLSFFSREDGIARYNSIIIPTWLTQHLKSLWIQKGSEWKGKQTWRENITSQEARKQERLKTEDRRAPKLWISKTRERLQRSDLRETLDKDPAFHMAAHGIRSYSRVQRYDMRTTAIYQTFCWWRSDHLQEQIYLCPSL